MSWKGWPEYAGPSTVMRCHFCNGSGSFFVGVKCPACEGFGEKAEAELEKWTEEKVLCAIYHEPECVCQKANVPSIQILCAWCEKNLGSRPCAPQFNGTVSHGMCTACFEKTGVLRG